MFLGSNSSFWVSEYDIIKLNYKCPFNGNDFTCDNLVTKNQVTSIPDNIKNKLLIPTEIDDHLIKIDAFSGMVHKKSGFSGDYDIGYAIKRIAYPINVSRLEPSKLDKDRPAFSKPGYEVVEITSRKMKNGSENVSTSSIITVDNTKDAQRIYNSYVSGNKDISKFKSIFIKDPVETIPESKIIKNGTKFAEQSFNYLKSLGLHGYDKSGKPITEINPIENYSRYSRDLTDLVAARPDIDYTKTYSNQEEFEEALEKAGYDNYIVDSDTKPKYSYETANEVAELHNIISGNKIPTDMLLYSGISDQLGKQLPTEPGSVFENPNFLSTSWKKTVAKQFGGSESKSSEIPVFLEIIARKGTPALATEIWQDEYPNMKDVQWMRGEHGFVDNPDKLEKYGGKNSQREVILNSGQKYKVRSLDTSGKYAVLKVETLP